MIALLRKSHIISHSDSGYFGHVGIEGNEAADRVANGAAADVQTGRQNSAHRQSCSRHLEKSMNGEHERDSLSEIGARRLN